MWALKIILLVLPAIAYCGIRIKINPGRTEAETTISLSGSDKARISATEQKTFNVDVATMKKAIKAWTGKRVDDCPNPDVTGDVRRTLTPVGYKIIGIHSKPDAVVSVEYENFSKKIEAQYSTTIEKSVEEEISHGWSTSGELSVGQEINYNVNVGAASVGGSTSLSYTSGWGKDKSESKTVSLGTSSTVQVTVPPGGKVIATLSASSATLEVEIYYEATLSGGVECHKSSTSKTAYSIYGLLEALNLPTQLNSTEHLSISFYSNAKLKVMDGSELPAEIKV